MRRLLNNNTTESLKHCNNQKRVLKLVQQDYENLSEKYIQRNNCYKSALMRVLASSFLQTPTCQNILDTRLMTQFHSLVLSAIRTFKHLRIEKERRIH